MCERGRSVEDREKLARYEQTVLPHLGAAYNLARWLTRNNEDAEDVVQEACLRAFRYLEGFHGANARAWLLAIVRNCFYTWRRQDRLRERTVPFNEELHDAAGEAGSPAQILIREADIQLVKTALEDLPAEYREVLVLRELEGMAYKEIAGIAGVPLGTVMSRLARARGRLQEVLAERMAKES